MTPASKRIDHLAGEQKTHARKPLELASAVREVKHAGYHKTDLFHDIGAGLVVGIVAIPLSMALAMATGVPPQHGLYTAIVAGAITAVLGGSRAQVTGPTAAFVVILVPIVHKHGMGGLLVASMLAGIMLVLMGYFRFGRLIEFVPYPVTSGFTAGIAIVIATLQIKDCLGLEIEEMPESFVDKVAVIIQAVPSAHAPDVAVAAIALTLLILAPRLSRKIPGPVWVLPLMGVAAWGMREYAPEWTAATINSRFSYMSGGELRMGIPQSPPLFAWPWSWPGANGQPFVLSFDLIRELLPSAMAIAVLAAIESLLSAVIADGITGQKHRPDPELIGLGIGNIVSTFFGGFAATGAIARTATNVRFGARSPLASVVHAAVILAALLALAPLLGYLPTAALAALLLMVAWNMSEARHVLYVVRIAPKSDAFVLLTCLSLTVLFDMIVAVTAGLILASFLFIRRMTEVSGAKLVPGWAEERASGPQHGVLVYEIAGPLFFGAAEKAMSEIDVVGVNVKVVVFDFRQVPAMDVTGFINLQSAMRKLEKRRIAIVLGGLQGQPLRVLEKAGWKNEPGTRLLCPDFDDALNAAAAISPA